MLGAPVPNSRKPDHFGRRRSRTREREEFSFLGALGSILIW